MIYKLSAFVLYRIRNLYRRIFIHSIRRHLGYCGKNVEIFYPFHSTDYSNIYLSDHTNIMGYSCVITVSGKFIMKRNSGAAQGLTVITGNHTSRPGVFFKELTHKEDIEKDVIVEEDVWIGANVTLLDGVTIGRGAVVGAGSVCRKSVPPYAIVAGNPAKVVGFRFNPEEVTEHEKALYPQEERITPELLQKNYDRYFIRRIDEIRQYLK